MELRVDINKRLAVPSERETRLRPDMLLYSTEYKSLIIIELTVPWESRIDEPYERKRLKYSEQCDDCREKRWYVWGISVKEGCRVFI